MLCVGCGLAFAVCRALSDWRCCLLRPVWCMLSDVNRLMIIACCVLVDACCLLSVVVR